MNTLIFKSETGIEIKEDPDYNKVLLIQKWLNFECSGLRIGSNFRTEFREVINPLTGAKELIPENVYTGGTIGVKTSVADDLTFTITGVERPKR